MTLERAQVFDVSEEYIQRGYERSVQCVRVWAVTDLGRTVSALVTDVPHEIYIDPSNEASGLTDLVSVLNEHLLKNPADCRRTDCENKCKRKKVYDGPPCLESCQVHRRTDAAAVIGADQVRRKAFEGYEAEPRIFWRFKISRSYYARPAKSFFESRGVRVYECQPDPVASFIQLKNFAGFEWYEWPQGPTVRFEDFNAVKGEWPGMAPFRNLCLDIETISVKYNNEDSDAAKYPCGVVCVSDGTTRTAYVLGDEIAGYEEGEVKRFDSELEMLRGLRDDLLSAHIWSGWNSDGFDIPYIFKRGEQLGDASFRKFRDGRTIRFVNDERTGERKVFCPGFIFLDYCKVVKEDTRTRPYDYKLNTIAEHYGLGAKDDMPYDQIHGAFHGSAEDRGRLVRYCAQDVALTQKIGKMIGAVPKLVAKSRVKRIRPQDELYRGAAFVTLRKVQEYLAGEFLMPSRKETYDRDGKKTFELSDALRLVQGYEELLKQEGYTGGFVRDPIVGFFENFSVGTLDFNSLYPSIMRDGNMCMSTLLARPGLLDKEWVSTSRFAFAQDREGVFPKIMREMVQKRNDVRARIAVLEEELKTAGPDKLHEFVDELEQLEALQTEYKIVANALYGQTGASTSALYMKAIAQSTCQRGAELAQMACHIIDEDPRIPSGWTVKERLEYTERMQRYESGLDAEKTKQFLEKRSRFRNVMGLRVIYGDTDSLMIHFAKSTGADQTLEWLKEVAEYINKESGILGTGGILKMGTEDVSSMLLVGKKMYVKYARAIKDGEMGKPKMKIAGMDNRSKSPFVRQQMKAMCEVGIKEGKDVSQMYEDAVQKVALGKVPRREMKHTSVLNKSPELYVNEAHAVAARQMIAAGLSVRVGDRVEYYRCLIVNSGGKKSDCVVAADLVESGGYDLDWVAYAEETIEALKPLKLLVRKNYERLSNIRHYHVIQGCKKLPPAQVSAAIVGDKKRVQTAQAGPMDGFVKRTKSDRPKPQAKVRKAKGRDFDEILTE